MIIILPLTTQNSERAQRLAEWLARLAEFDRYPADHQLVIVHCRNTDASLIKQTLNPVFRSVLDMTLTDMEPGRNPQTENLLFRRAAHQIDHEATKQPWIWLSPEALPIRPDWLRVIDTTYKANAQQPFRVFMLSRSANPSSGVGVYPHNTSLHSPLAVRCEAVPFWVNARTEIFPKLIDTRLIQVGSGADFKNDPAQLERLHGDAVIYSGWKGELIELLSDHADSGGFDNLPKLEIVTLAKIPTRPEKQRVTGPQQAKEVDEVVSPRAPAPAAPTATSTAASDSPFAAKGVPDLRVIVRRAASDGMLPPSAGEITGTAIASMNKGECLRLLALIPADKQSGLLG